MTDPRRADDDLVSAVLDGEATAEERARVDADPVLAERLAEFESVAHHVRGPVEPVDDAVREQAIARALAAAGGSAASAEADVIGIDRARNGRRFEVSRRMLAVAAAGIAVLALAGGLLTLGDGDGAQDRAAGTGDDAGVETAAGDITVPELDLGDVGDAETLRLRINETTGLEGEEAADNEAFAEEEPRQAPGGVDEPSADVAASAPSSREGDQDASAIHTIEDCTIELIESRPQLIGQLAQGTVTYQGTEAYVFAYNDADLGGAIGIVTSTADCTVLTEIPL
jgi:hypothetical protein